MCFIRREGLILVPAPTSDCMVGTTVGGGREGVKYRSGGEASTEENGFCLRVSRDVKYFSSNFSSNKRSLSDSTASAHRDMQ